MNLADDLVDGAGHLGLGRRHHRDRLVEEVGQAATEHPLRRAVHPLDAASADGDDADQHRVEGGARALGLQGDGASQGRELAVVVVAAAADVEPR